MRRWPLFSALAYVALVTLGLFAVPAAPGVGASGAAIARHAAQHAGGVRLTAWLGAMSIVPLVLLVARLRQLVVGAARDVLLLGTVGLISSTMVWVWFGAGLALHAASLAPATARALADVSAYFGPVLTVAVTLMVAPVGVAAWRRDGHLPVWLAGVSAVVAVEQVIESFTVFGTAGPVAPGGTLNMTVGPVLFLIWLVAAGVAASAPTTGPAPAGRLDPVGSARHGPRQVGGGSLT